MFEQQFKSGLRYGAFSQKGFAKGCLNLYWLLDRRLGVGGAHFFVQKAQIGLRAQIGLQNGSERLNPNAQVGFKRATKPR